MMGLGWLAGSLHQHTLAVLLCHLPIFSSLLTCLWCLGIVFVVLSVQYKQTKYRLEQYEVHFGGMITLTTPNICSWQ